MTWTEKLPSLKGIARFFYVATHWDTISHDLEEYRRQIKDREEWAIAMLKGKEELHRLQRERLTAITEKAEADLHQTTPRLYQVLSDLIDTTKLLGIVLSWENPGFQKLALSPLNPPVRRLVEATIVKVTPRPSPFAALRDLINVIDKPLAEVLGLGPPPPPVPKQSP